MKMVSYVLLLLHCLFYFVPIKGAVWKKVNVKPVSYLRNSSVSNVMTLSMCAYYASQRQFINSFCYDQESKQCHLSDKPFETAFYPFPHKCMVKTMNPLTKDSKSQGILSNKEKKFIN